MKIAVVTDDGKTISAHFGRARYYKVLTAENGAITAEEQRPKPSHEHGQHHHEGGTVQLFEDPNPAAGTVQPDNTHGAMAAPVTDCEILLTRGMGQRAYESLRAAGIRPIITDVRDIDEAVRQYLKGELVDHPERLH